MEQKTKRQSLEESVRKHFIQIHMPKATKLQADQNPICKKEMHAPKIIPIKRIKKPYINPELSNEYIIERKFAGLMRKNNTDYTSHYNKRQLIPYTRFNRVSVYER